MLNAKLSDKKSSINCIKLKLFLYLYRNNAQNKNKNKMTDYTITEFTKLVDKLCQLSANINYYLLEEEFKNFKEWLLFEHRIELFDDFENHIDSLIQNETINIKDHIYLSIRENEKIINNLMSKINLQKINYICLTKQKTKL